MFPVKRKHHGFLVNAQKFAIRHCGCRPHSQSLSGQATFSEELSLAQDPQRCFLANLGYNSESNLACLDVEHRVSRITLRKDCLLLGKRHDFSTLSDRGKELAWVEVGLFLV